MIDGFESHEQFVESYGQFANARMRGEAPSAPPAPVSCREPREPRVRPAIEQRLEAASSTLDAVGKLYQVERAKTRAEMQELRDELSRTRTEADAQATMATMEHDRRMAAEMVLTAAQTFHRFSEGDASYLEARHNLTQAIQAYSVWEAGLGRSALNCGPTPIVDDFEVQTYMIEHDGAEETPWAVRDMDMQITLSYHKTRDEAVKACRKCRERVNAHS